MPYLANEFFLYLLNPSHLLLHLSIYEYILYFILQGGGLSSSMPVQQPAISTAAPHQINHMAAGKPGAPPNPGVLEAVKKVNSKVNKYIYFIQGSEFSHITLTPTLSVFLFFFKYVLPVCQCFKQHNIKNEIYS